MELAIFFDKDIHDPAARGEGLTIEASSFNFIAEISYLSLRNRHGAQAIFHHVTGVIATEEAQEREHWAHRFGGPGVQPLEDRPLPPCRGRQGGPCVLPWGHSGNHQNADGFVWYNRLKG